MPLVPLPPGSSHQNWDDLVQIMARLRRSCPWDREQTHESLVRYLIEETYEVVDAIEGGDEAELCEELGDLLFQVVFHAQLATERGKFSVADVIDSLSNKMIRRHPHVFGDVAVANVAEVWQNWDQLKALEPSSASRTSKLDGIPSGMPALAARPEDAREGRARGLRLARRARRSPRSSPKSCASSPTRNSSGQPRERRPARARRTRRRALHGRQPRAQDEHRRRRRDARRERRSSIAASATWSSTRSPSGRELGDMTLDELEDLWQAAKTAA